MNPGSKVAVITGAGSGIGRATTLVFLADGYKVALAGRRLSTLEETVELAGDNSQNAIAVVTDITVPEQVTNLFSKAKETFGRIDVVFNNAGAFAPPVALEDMTLEQWKTVVDTNLTGMFLCVREAFRLMKDQDPMGGRIINNGSVSAYSPRPNSAPYTASKHGVTGLTKSAALDGRKYDIICSQIDIGNARTSITSRMTAGVPQSDGAIKPEAVMNVDNVASAVLYMANLPPEANVQFMTVMATKMPFIGRG
ncbi:MAG: SDR family oxidoreductase [Dehalococcoidales bacterium]|nr:MAG: SDR family oxidoreductase [Dehalococcoidales bacterium]